MKYLLTISSLILAVYSWEVDYYLGSDCMGEELGSGMFEQTGNVCVPVNVENVDSVEVVATGTSTGDLSFYVGSTCSGLLLGSIQSAGCLPFAEDGFGSVGINN